MIRSPIRVLSLALIFSYVFFYEYLPPVRKVHVPYDLEGYHHSLNDYAFQQLRQGHWPQWDPSIYSGMSFASNVQVALYYPGTWLMFLANAGRARLSYQSLLDLDLAHVPLAFTLCFFWLRRKHLDPLAAALGAMIYAYSGYMCLQLQHLGLIVAYTWLPLCLMGVDDVAAQRNWRPLWKVAVGSALAFLGGYPPTWLAIVLTVGVYALANERRTRLVPATFAALVFSLALCAVQVLPAWEANQFRAPELRYGLGIKDPLFFISYFIPNFYDFAITTDVMAHVGQEYLYLGAPGIFGLLWVLRSGLWRRVLPAVAMIAACLLVVVNPFAVVWDAIKWSALLADVVRSSYFLAGVTPGLALIAAIALDDFLRREVRPVPVLAAAPLVAWSILLFARPHASGWPSALDSAAAVAAFALALAAYRSRPSAGLAAVVLLCAGAEYKAFGTSNRQNAQPGQGTVYSSTRLGAMNVEAYAATRRDPDTRILFHELGPQASIIRHLNWKSPNGFDPFLSTQYRELGRRDGEWLDDRTLQLDPLRLDVMQRFGVRFVVTAAQGSKYADLLKHPRYRMVGRNDSYYKVFEFLDAKPIYAYPGSLHVERRDAEHRTIHVDSAQGGIFTFAEQTYPGWSATIDGVPTTIYRWQVALQAVRVPAGQHVVEFHYTERLLLVGAIVSLVSLALLALSLRNTGNTASPAA